MTSDDYRKIVQSFGLTPNAPSRDGKTLHRTKEGMFQHVLDPEDLSAEEREDAIELLRWRLMIFDD